MVFTLEALQAQHGDALLLHWKGKKRHLLLIDGGPPIVWGTVLRKRLDALRAQLHDDGDPLLIEGLMISHIDDDHIGGIVSLTREMVDAEKNEIAPTLDIKDLWHNAFEDLVQDGAAPSALAAVAGVGASAASTTIANWLPLEDAAAVVASVDQGRKLRDNARALAIPINRAFGSKLIERPTARVKPKNLGDGLTLEILGPRRDRLEALQKEWKKIVAKKKKGQTDPASVAAFLDESIFNLSSIIAVARASQKSILLTGDARGDDILDALAAAKLMKNGRAHFDVLKVPHHGSERNVTEDFFRAVTADHYVVSANGRDGNPDEPMLEMLVVARGKARYRIYLTNAVPHAVAKLKDLKVKAKAKFTLVTRSESKPSMLIELGGTKLPAALRP
jgi:hypothetical protein